MRGFILAVIVALSVASALVVAACGETDPAQAPAGSSIAFVTSSGQVTQATYSKNFPVDPNFHVPTSCSELFATQFQDLCNQLLAAGSSALDAAGITSCAKQTDWLPLVDQPVSSSTETTWGQFISGNWDVGDCGYYEAIIIAIVTKTSSTSENAVVEPINGVEVRWVADGGLELYELADIPGEIDPLANPYLDETDERGTSTLKVRVPVPIATGEVNDFYASVDIGVAQASYNFSFTSEEDDSDTTSGDDDTDDDVG